MKGDDPPDEAFAPEDWRRTFYRRTAQLRHGNEAFRALLTGNCSLPRDAFLEAGGFSPDFRRWGGEDTELGWRLFSAGMFFVPANRAAIYHQEQEETHPEEGWRQEGRAANAGLIRSKIPHRFYRRLTDSGPFEVPKVSWVVATAAGRRTAELLAQMQAQTSGDWEAFFPGDYWRGGDPRLRLLPDEAGTPDQRVLRAIAAARGEYVALVSGAAGLSPLLLDRAVRFLDASPRASAATVGYAGLDAVSGDAAWGTAGLPAFALVARREWAKVLPDAADLADAWRRVQALSWDRHLDEALVTLPPPTGVVPGLRGPGGSRARPHRGRRTEGSGAASPALPLGPGLAPPAGRAGRPPGAGAPRRRSLPRGPGRPGSLGPDRFRRPRPPPWCSAGGRCSTPPRSTGCAPPTPPAWNGPVLGASAGEGPGRRVGRLPGHLPLRGGGRRGRCRRRAVLGILGQYQRRGPSCRPSRRRGRPPRRSPRGGVVKVCMFVKNSFEYDARVTKEARSLVEGGHEVTVVAIHVPGVTAERETTADGIRVVRVNRLSFGMRAVQQAHARFVVDTEERRARLTGEEVDEGRIRRYSSLLPASTATPGETQAAAVARPAPVSPGDPGHRSTAPVSARPGPRLLHRPRRLALSQTVRYGFRAAKFVVQGPLKAVRARALDRRFLEAGLATGAQVWHCHDLNTLAIGVRCKQARPGTRLVYDSHELATERSRMGRWAKWRAGRQERRGLGHTDERIWTTRTRAEYIVRRYGIPFPTLIHNVPERMEVKQGWDLRERLGIPADRRILLYQGSIQEFRGIEESIEAVTLLDRCVLVVIGYGYHRPALEEMVRRRGLDDRVRFFGPIPNDELLYYTASADVGLCVIRGQSLSYRWSMPNKLFEYMMAGIPIVASDFEEMGRVVREGGSGHGVRPRRPAEHRRRGAGHRGRPGGRGPLPGGDPGGHRQVQLGRGGEEAARPLPAPGAGGGLTARRRTCCMGKYFWGALVIIAMWVAVLVIGVAAEGEFVVNSPGGDVRVPVVWGVALMALIGSWVVAGAAFRNGAEKKAAEAKPAEKPLPPAEG